MNLMWVVILIALCCPLSSFVQCYCSREHDNTSRKNLLCNTCTPAGTGGELYTSKFYHHKLVFVRGVRYQFAFLFNVLIRKKVKLLSMGQPSRGCIVIINCFLASLQKKVITVFVFCSMVYGVLSGLD